MVTAASESESQRTQRSQRSQRARGRPTIADVAQAAGVSIAVVSYALNGRPGVSVATRERVLRVADEFGWRPSATARAVRSGPQAVVLAMTGSPGTLARDPAFFDFLAHASQVVATRGLSLDLQVVESPEVAATSYRQWWAERRYDAVVVPDLLVDDPRIDALMRTRLPTVVLGSPGTDAPFTCAWMDDGDAARRLAAYLADLGHEHVALVSRQAELQSTRVRVEAMQEVLAEHDGVLVHLATDATAEASAASTRGLLTASERPTAIVYDTDEMALAGLDVARRSGFEVPWDLSIVAGNDSALCRLATPALTTVPRPMAELGIAAGATVLAALDGRTETHTLVPVGPVAVRGSTAPAPGTGS